MAAPIHRSAEWECRIKASPIKYVWLEGNRTERKQLRRELKLQPKPYPKRCPIEFFLARIEKIVEDARLKCNTQLDVTT